jgi:hypothetical protein
MARFLRSIISIASTLICLTNCKRASDGIQPSAENPASIQGEWRLAVSGGGLTGIMTPVPADRDFRMVLGPDSTYREYSNGKLMTTSTYQFRKQASPYGGPDEQVLVIKASSFYHPYYVTLFTLDKLNFTTGGGCALNVEYVRTNATASPLASR